MSLPCAILIALCGAASTMSAQPALFAPSVIATRTAVQDTANVHREIDSINTMYIKAFADTDVTLLVSLYDDDANELLDKGRVVHGHAALLAYWHKWMQAIGPIQLTLALQSLWVAGNHAYETGTYTTGYRTKQGQAASVSGNYATIWKREGGGWKIEAVFDTPK